MTLPDALVVSLQRWDRRRRRLVLLRGGAEAVLIGGAVIMATMAIDRLFSPGPGLRWVCGVAIWVSGAGVLLGRGILPALRPWPLLRIARQVEQFSGGLDERLSSAVELSARPAAGISPWMVARTVAMAAQTADGIDPLRLQPLRREAKALGGAGLMLAVVVVFAVIPGTNPWLLRAVAPSLGLGRPSVFRIAVQPGDVRVARGSPLVIGVRVRPVPRSVQAVVTWEDGLVERLHLSGEGEAFALDFPAVTRSFRYHIRADDGESPEAVVTVVDPPELAGLHVAVTPPAYTGLPTREHAGGDVDMVAGSRVTIRVEADSTQLQGVVLLRDGHDDLALAPRDDRHWQTQILPESSQPYRLRLVGRDGIIVEPATRWLLTVRPDAAPLVSAALLQSGAGMAAPDEQVLVRIDAADDHGLRELRLVVADDQRDLDQRDLLAGRGGAPRSVNRIEAVDLAELMVSEGDQLTVRIEATDQGGVRSVSPPITVDLVAASGAESARLLERLRTHLMVIEGALTDLRAAERSWGGLLRTFRPEDPAAQRGELLLLGSRTRQFTTRLEQAAAALLQVAIATDLPAAARVLAIAESLEAWVALHRLAIDGAISAAIAPSSSATALQRGRDLTDAAYRALDPLRSDLLVVIARLEAEALSAATSAALRRAEGAAVILQAQDSWHASRWVEGLELVVRDGQGEESDVVHRAVGAPHIEAVLAAGQVHNISARWTGELRVETAGDQVFAVTVDDGARLQIGGTDVLPAEAWRPQGATRYVGRIALTEGWHPVVIDYSQNQGEAIFTVEWGPAGTKARPLAMTDLRHLPPGPVDEALIRTMLVATPTAGLRAQQDLTRAAATGATVAEVLERLASDTGRERLQHLAREATDPVARLRALADRTPTAVDAEPAVAGLQRVNRLATLARDHLAEAVDQERNVGGALAIERAMVRELLTRADAIRRLRDNLPAADRAAALRRELTAVEAGVDAVAARLNQTRGQLVDRARRSGATPPERGWALVARERLAVGGTEALDALQTGLSELSDDTRVVAKVIDERVTALDKALAVAEDAMTRSDDERLAVLADEVHTRVVAMLAGSTLAPTQAAVHDDIRQLAAALRRRGRMAAAQTLESSLRDHDPRVVAEAFASSVRRPQGKVDAVALALSALTRVDRAFAMSGRQNPSSAVLDAGREDLFATAVALRLAVTTQPADAGRQRGILTAAEEAEQLAQAIMPSASAVADLMQRVQQSLESTDEGERIRGTMADLAERLAAAAAAPDLRAEAAAALPPPTAPSRAEWAAIRTALAARIDAALAEDRRRATEEQRARDDFAQIEQQTAETLAAAATRATSLQPLAAQRLVEAAAEARRRSELARASSTLPGAESAQLAASAVRAAGALNAKVVAPMARSVMTDAEVDMEALSEFALHLAEVARIQVDAAQRLQQVLVRRGSARVDLARSLAEVDRLLGTWTANDASVQAHERAVLAQLQEWRQGQSSPTAVMQLHESLLAEGARIMAEGDGAAHVAAAAAILNAVADSARALAAMPTADETVALRQAATGHLALMRATAPAVGHALSAVGVLRSTPSWADGQVPIDVDPEQAALRAASAAVHAPHAGDGAWRHAADLIAAVAADQTMGGGGGASGASVETSSEDPTAVMDLERPVGDDHADWLLSVGPVRGEVFTSGVERFSAEYQEAIRAYFRSIAREDQP